ncbi:hypothetical protein FRC02_001188 [Tulasnella sp. 418]|nr:hypothetical protein FRC02_001188 [Tulasnella sp. 418]
MVSSIGTSRQARRLVLTPARSIGTTQTSISADKSLTSFLKLHSARFWCQTPNSTLQQEITYPSILRFVASKADSVRNTYFREPPSHGRAPWPPRNPRWSSGGFLGRLKRRLNSFPENTIIYAILGLNGAVFMMWWYATESWRKFRDPSLYYSLQRNFTTSLDNLKHGRIWTLLTSSFSHEATGHILLNGLTFWFMAPNVISLLGNSSFLALYLGGGIVASGISALSNMIKGRPQQGSHGASGAINAVLACYATLFPRATFLLFFVIPVPAWACVGGLAVYDLISAIGDKRLGTDTAGHVGGFAAGCLYALRKVKRLPF